VFSISSALFFLSTLVLFAGLLYIPELMQDVRHESSFEAGLFLIPLLAGLIGATAGSGSMISRTGHYKVFPIAGAVLAGGGMLVISRLTATSPVWVLAGQNAVDYPYSAWPPAPSTSSRPWAGRSARPCSAPSSPPSSPGGH
jgi:hypothetical protein